MTDGFGNTTGFFDSTAVEPARSGDDGSGAQPEPNSPRPHFSWGGITHTGGVRDHNEDAFFASDGVCVVADGMGGHAAGEVASRLVTSMVAEVFGSRRLSVDELPDFVSALNAAILRTAIENGTNGMGTTVVGVALISNGDVMSPVVFHVGDSRCYLLANGRLTQLTVDHSHVQELVDAGAITVEQAAIHPLRNVVTRALGASAIVEADYTILDNTDCRLLLCSDGLTGEIDDDRIWELMSSIDDPQAAAETLVEAALAEVARDNVTAIVLDVHVATPELDETAEIVVDPDVTADPDVTGEAAIVGDPTITREVPITSWAPPLGAAHDHIDPTPTAPSHTVWSESSEHPTGAPVDTAAIPATRSPSWEDREPPQEGST